MKKKKIAVVGAGAAGLMAALEVRDAGHDVQVFEARDRVGGRIHTVRFDDGRFANAGAEWLNSSDDVALSLVDRYRLDLVPNSGYEAFVDEGMPIPLDEVAYPVLHDAFMAAAGTLTDLEEPWNDQAARGLDCLSIADWVSHSGADDDTKRRFLQDHESEFMAPATEISMAAAALSAVLTNNDRAFRLREGTARLPEAMADDLGDRVCLSQAVRAVHQVDGRVIVRTERGLSEFDAVILALPLPALARLEMDPDFELPWIAPGRGGKLFVPFDNADFDSGCARVAASTEMGFLYANAAHQPGPGTILTAYSYQTLEPKDVLATFGRWFPELVRSRMEPSAVWWHLDPHSGTTYSAPQPGYLDALRRLREPQSHIVLAGEHTEILFGYIESALVSGRRAARVLASVA